MLCSSARLFIYWENAPTKPSLAYFSKIVFAYKVGLFFSKIFFFESAPCKWKLFCIQSELIIVSKLCKTSYNLNWTLLLNSILYALLMHDLGLRKVQVQFFVVLAWEIIHEGNAAAVILELLFCIKMSYLAHQLGFILDDGRLWKLAARFPFLFRMSKLFTLLQS